MYMYAIAPVPLSALRENPRRTSLSFLKAMRRCVSKVRLSFSLASSSLYSSSPPVVNPDAAAASMVWSYIGELIFNIFDFGRRCEDGRQARERNDGYLIWQNVY